MKKVTKKALSLTVTALLLMNSFTVTAFAIGPGVGPGHGPEAGPGHGPAVEPGHGPEVGPGHGPGVGPGHEIEPPKGPGKEEAGEEIVIELPDEQNEEDQQGNEEGQQEVAGSEDDGEKEEGEAEEAGSEDDREEEEGEAEEAGSEDNKEEEEGEAEEAGSEDDEEEEEAEEAEEEPAAEEPAEEENTWGTYTLYNYISVDGGKSYISLNTQEDGISAEKSAAEFHQENGSKKYDLYDSEYEADDYDLSELVYTAGKISYVEKSRALEGQPYFTARLDRVEAVAGARFRSSSSVAGIESFDSISGAITFHRNWYLTLVTPMTDNKLLTGIRLGDGKDGNGNGKYYGIEYTDTFRAVDSRVIPFETKLNADQYRIDDYDFTGLTLEFGGETYEYRPDGPVAGDGEGFHYYTVSFLKLDKIAKSTYGGGYLVEGWPVWAFVSNWKDAGENGYPYQAGYYHRDYQVTLQVGDAPAAVIADEEPAIEEPAAEETVKEEPVVEEAPAAAIVIGTIGKIAEEVKIEPVKKIEVIEEKAPVADEAAKVEEVAKVEEAPAAAIVEEEAKTEPAAEPVEAPAEEEQIQAVEEEAQPVEEETQQIEEEVQQVIEDAEPVEEETSAPVIEEIVKPARRHHKEKEVFAAASPAASTDTVTAQEEQAIVEEDVAPAEEAEVLAAGLEISEEEIAESEAPLAMAPFEAVTAAAQEEPAAPQAAEVIEVADAAEPEGPTFVAVATMQVADFVEMADADVPAASGPTWSLANMIFGAMSILLAVFTLASKGISRKLKAAAVILAAATAAIVLVNSDLSGAMVTADKGTLGVVILNVFEAVFASTASNETRHS